MITESTFGEWLLIKTLVKTANWLATHYGFHCCILQQQQQQPVAMATPHALSVGARGALVWLLHLRLPRIPTETINSGSSGTQSTVPATYHSFSRRGPPRCTRMKTFIAEGSWATCRASKNPGVRLLLLYVEPHIWQGVYSVCRNHVACWRISPHKVPILLVDVVSLLTDVSTGVTESSTEPEVSPHHQRWSRSVDDSQDGTLVSRNPALCRHSRHHWEREPCFRCPCFCALKRKTVKVFLLPR